MIKKITFIASLISLLFILSYLIYQKSFIIHNNNLSNIPYDCKSRDVPCLQYQFSFMNYTWENQDIYEEYIGQKGYNQTLLAGVKVSNSGRMFVSLPRWKINANGYVNPATFCEIKQNSSKKNPLMTPYPSWNLNEHIKEGDGFDNDALQSVLGFEIVDETLYVLDQGNIDGKFVPGTIKLVKINLNTNKIEYVFRFTEELAGPDSFLNDLVVDQKNNFIYITDSNIFHEQGEKLNGAIISIDISTTPYKAKRQLSGSKFTDNDEDMWLTINNQKVMYDEPMRTAADGIALTPDCETLTFCPLTSYNIFDIPTKYLRDFTLTDKELEKYIKPTLQREFSSDGLAYGQNGELFLTSLQGNGIYSYSDQKDGYLTQNEQNQKWPDTIGFNNHGSIVYTSNQLYNFNNDEIDFNDIYKPFYRIYSLYVGTNSYLNGYDQNKRFL